MSKTDKTRPLRVKAMDLPTGLDGHHDHRTGPCDLPPRPTQPLTCLWGGHATTSCYWSASDEFLRSPAGVCGCSAHAKKRDYYAIAQMNRRRTANRREEHQARTDISIHGLHDTLDDVSDWTTLHASDRDVDDFHNEIDRNAALRTHLTAATGLPDTSLVVDVRDTWSYDCCEDCDLPDADGVRVDVLHNDGRRETLRFDEHPLTTLTGTTR